MAQRIQMMTTEGMKTFPVYNDYLEMDAEYVSGTLRDGDEAIYRGHVCVVLGRYADEDAEAYLQMIVVGAMGPEFAFNVCG